MQQNNDLNTNQLLDEGLRCYHSGNLEDALFYFEQLLKLANDNVELLHTIVKLLQEMKNFDKAVFYGEKLLVISPENDEFILSQAENFFYLNDYHQALALYLKLQKIYPSDLHVLNRITSIYKKEYNVAECENKITCVDDELVQDVIVGESLALSRFLIDKGNYKEARVLLGSILIIDCASAEVNGLFGLLLEKENDCDKAIFYFNKSMVNFSFKYLTALTRCIEKVYGVPAVIHYLEEIIKQHPHELLNKKLLGLYYHKNDNYAGANDIFSLLYKEDDKDIMSFKYKVISQFKLFEQANNFFDNNKFISIFNDFVNLHKILPDDNEVTTNLMNFYINMGEFEKAYSICKKLDETIPDNKTNIWNKHLYYRATRERKKYFESYLAGRHIRCRISSDIVSSKIWNGENISGKRVLIVREQGIGDEILFASNYGWVIEDASRVDIYCSSRLHKSFSRIYPAAHFYPIDEGTLLTSNDPQFQELITLADKIIHSGDLPSFYYKENELPLYQEKYFAVTNENNLFWQRELNIKIDSKKPKVGLIWRSGFVNTSRNTAYLTIEEVALIIASIPEAEIVNCMYVECEEELNKIEMQTERKIHRLNNLDQKNDFENTAAMLRNLDLLIGAYTSTLSLAAAVGTPIVAYGADYLKEDKKLKKDALYYSNVSHISLPLNDREMRREAVSMIVYEIRRRLKI